MLALTLQINLSEQETSLAATCAKVDSTLGTEVDAALDAISAYREKIYDCIGETVSLTPLSATPAGTADEQAEALSELQVLIDTIEHQVANPVSNGNAVGDWGYTNDLREARAALIAALYTLYKAQYALL